MTFSIESLGSTWMEKMLLFYVNYNVHLQAKPRLALELQNNVFSLFNFLKAQQQQQQQQQLSLDKLKICCQL